jgi:succinate dehydrogenase / fumarate reductase flavoprotein subunit
MECTGLDLVLDGNKISGLVGYWRETGRFVLFKTRAIILATGGSGKAWKVTSNSWEYTGDGLGMAYRAGAELIDMEFTQFHPTGMVWPPSVKGILVTEGVRGDGGILLNSEGERFMFSYIPEKFASETANTEEEASRWLEGDREARRPPELLTRDVVARAIKKEVEAGRGSPNGGAFLDIASRRPADFIKKKLPSMYHQFKELAEIDITEEPMEVGPTLHYFMGGIRVNSDSQQTTIQGLYACGECAGGMHGANRLGGNSLSDLLVFGKLAGEGAAHYIKSFTDQLNCSIEKVRAVLKDATDILNREEGNNPYLLHEKLQNILQTYVSIVRTGDELELGLKELEALKIDIRGVFAHSSAQYNPGWNEALDLKNLIITAEAVTRAAIVREESRGAHTRLDFDGEREDGLKYNVVIKKTQSGMSAEKIPRDDPPKELADIAFASLNKLEGNGFGA